MASLNKIMLIGNCGRDPEMRYLPSGVALCNLSIATSSKRKDKQSGETIEDTQWHRITFYDKLAEIVGQYVKSGMRLYVEGRIQYRKYTDKDGQPRTSTEVIASEMQMLSSGDHSDRPAMAPAAEPRGTFQTTDDTDDIPF